LTRCSSPASKKACSAYKNDGTDGDYENRFGDHHDGMEYFGLSATANRTRTAPTAPDRP
jgi:hypothetical protein